MLHGKVTPSFTSKKEAQNLTVPLKPCSTLSPTYKHVFRNKVETITSKITIPIWPISIPKRVFQKLETEQELDSSAENLANKIVYIRLVFSLHILTPTMTEPSPLILGYAKHTMLYKYVKLSQRVKSKR